MKRSRVLGYCAGIVVMSGSIAPLTLAIPVVQGTEQTQIQEIDRAIDEGMRLFNEGSKESLERAIVQFETAVQLSQTYSQKSQQAFALLALGRIYDDLGEKQKSLKFYNQSLPLWRAVGDRAGEATTLNNIGSVYNALGEKQKALEFYNQALPLRRAVGDRLGEAVTLHNIGSVYSDLGEKQKALEFYNQALPLRRAVGDRSGEAITLNNIGGVYDALGEKQKALEFYNQALPLLRAVGNRVEEARTLNNIGAVYDASREKQKALEFYSQALPLWRAVGDRAGEAATLNNIGSVYDDLGEKQKALVFYNQALPLLRAVGDRAGEAKTLNNIGVLFSQQGQVDRTIAFLKKSVDIFELLRRDIRGLSRTEQASYTQTIAFTYRNLADLLIQQNRLSEAQQVLELLKMRELKELESDQSSIWTRIQSIPISDAEKQAISAINPEAAKDIKSEVLPPIDRLSSHPLNQSAQSLLTAQPNSALIYPLMMSDRLWILAATPDGKLHRFSATIKRTDLESLVTEIRQQIEKCEKSTCDKTDTQTLNATTQKLYQHLLPPDLQTTLKTTNIKHLTFALDGSLRNIPIAALHTGSQYLIEQYSLSTVIAASLTDSRAKLPANPRILAAGMSQSATIDLPDFVRPKGPDRFNGLVNVKPEVEGIVRSDRNPQAFPGSILLDTQFTRPTVEQQIPNYPILHIASHGIFRPSFLPYSYLLLGSQQPWTITQLDQTKPLFANTHMVTLSACQTGLGGKDDTGMEIAGMSHAFLSQGAKALTASLWQVDDASTAILMQRFYQHLVTQPNSSKAIALQQAQLALLKTPRQELEESFKRSLTPATRSTIRYTKHKITSEQPTQADKTLDYTHPYYWSAFVLIGNSL